MIGRQKPRARRIDLNVLAPLFFVALFAAQAAALGGWKGQIIDRDSGAPIEGAVVLMVWSRCTFISFHGCNARYYDLAEALTDAGGRFVLVRPLFLRLFAFLVKDQHFMEVFRTVQAGVRQFPKGRNGRMVTRHQRRQRGSQKTRRLINSRIHVCAIAQMRECGRT
jgi:hypothetical protein